METTMITPNEIRSIRQRAELTQAELGKRVGVTRDAVASWEIGRTRPRGPAEILIRQLGAQLDAAATPVQLPT